MRIQIMRFRKWLKPQDERPVYSSPFAENSIVTGIAIPIFGIRKNARMIFTGVEIAGLYKLAMQCGLVAEIVHDTKYNRTLEEAASHFNQDDPDEIDIAIALRHLLDAEGRWHDYIDMKIVEQAEAALAKRDASKRIPESEQF